MEQHIEPPKDTDIDRIARILINANRLVQDICDEILDGTLDDLRRIQTVIFSKDIRPESSLELYSLGLAFGKVLIENNVGYDWWIVEDEEGRDVCIRYQNTSLLVFPETLLSKRVEDGEQFTLVELYKSLVEELECLIAQNLNP